MPSLVRQFVESLITGLEFCLTGGRSMPSGDWVHLDVKKIVTETDKAFLLQLDDPDLDDLWVPKSQVADAEDYAAGDRDCTVSVTDWWARQNGLAAED